MGDLSKINQVFFIFYTRELLVNRKDLQASTLVGLNWGNPVLDPSCTTTLQPTINAIVS